jgi:hypothetical protein
MTANSESRGMLVYFGSARGDTMTGGGRPLLQDPATPCETFGQMSYGQ